MNSITRSMIMCPTGADSVNLSENFFEDSMRSQSVIPEEPRETGKSKASKKKVMAPPMKYDLRTASAENVYLHLQELTKKNTIAAEYVRVIAPQLYAQRNPIVFGYIPAPPLEHITKQVIGEDGYFFKMTTAICGVNFIWHDRDSNMFLFWGSTTFKVVKAMNSIRWRIFKYCDMYSASEAVASEAVASEAASEAVANEAASEAAASEAANAEEDEYADMPGLISCGNSPDYEHPEQC